MSKKTGRTWRAEQIAKREEMVEYVRQLGRDGYSTKDIATKLCVPESTVRSLKKTIGYPWGDGSKPKEES